MRSRANKGSAKFELAVDPDLNLSERDLEQGFDHYSKWHWGIAPTKVIEWDDPDYPKTLVACGRFARLHIRLPKTGGYSRHPRLERDYMLQLSERAAANSHIAYDPNHPDQRLYLLVSPSTQVSVKKRLWDGNETQPIKLLDAARLAGGRHGKKSDYPDIMVKPIGVVSAVVYFTEKEGDPEGPYLHKMGEVTSYYPFICVDQKGRLWFAGGGYKAPFAGIED